MLTLKIKLTCEIIISISFKTVDIKLKTILYIHVPGPYTVFDLGHKIVIRLQQQILLLKLRKGNFISKDLWFI